MKDKIKNNYSIGVVTYIARYEKYFIPLIKQLISVFPDKEIICVINGHPDNSLQIEYLKNVTAFLKQFPNIKYITHETHQPIAKCWNWLALMSFSAAILILNDDIKVNLLFREDFEKIFTENQDFFIINNSWSHFLISWAMLTPDLLAVNVYNDWGDTGLPLCLINAILWQAL